MKLEKTYFHRIETDDIFNQLKVTWLEVNEVENGFQIANYHVTIEDVDLDEDMEYMEKVWQQAKAQSEPSSTHQFDNEDTVIEFLECLNALIPVIDTSFGKAFHYFDTHPQQPTPIDAPQDELLFANQDVVNEVIKSVDNQ